MEPTIEQYLDWYDKGLITIFPFILGNKSMIVMIIPIPQN
jgi:hypothetical protein